MANFKRKSCKNQVRCTLCTPHKWRGNHKGRFTAKDEAAVVASVESKPVASKQKNDNVQIRSLKQRLDNRQKKLDAYLARPTTKMWSNPWYDSIIGSLKKEISSFQAQLDALMSKSST